MTPLTKLYHADIGLPKNVPLPTPGTDLTYTQHAKFKALWVGLHELPARLPSCTLIEVEMFGDVPVKWVVRVVLNTKADLVLVLTRAYVVKTVWINAKSDTHPTLNRSRYAQPDDDL